MSNLIGATRVNAARQQRYRRISTFVVGHLGRILPFLSTLRIGRRASENQGSRMKRLITASRERLPLRFVKPALTDTRAG
jgi:hypothetical protein